MGIKKVFLVFPDDSESLDSIEAIFDNVDDAAAFTKRFKENSNFKIVKQLLNPAYPSNKEQSPYIITFKDDDLEPRETALVDFGDLIESAMNNERWVEYFGDDKKSFHVHFCHFATSLEEAVAIGKKKRDDFVASRTLSE